VGVLEGKRVIITGGAGGIGNGAVRVFHKEGAKVACTYNREKPDVPKGVLFEKCDIGSKADVDKVFDSLVGQLGGLDVFINAAGVHASTPAAEITEADWNWMFQLNVSATVFTNQAVFRHMRARGGSIVNMGSVEGVRGTAGNACYSASRGAIMSWTRSIALEWGKYNIRANSLAPAAYTKLAEKTMDRMFKDKAQMDAFLKNVIPLSGKMGDPEQDIAPILVFLASDASRYFTGQVVAADGGLMMLGS
jgi:NAD(P)-dependent dehydrogenase (short-subunit alcohol dehydrogenase family)